MKSHECAGSNNCSSVRTFAEIGEGRLCGETCRSGRGEPEEERVELRAGFSGNGWESQDGMTHVRGTSANRHGNKQPRACTHAATQTNAIRHFEWSQLPPESEAAGHSKRQRGDMGGRMQPRVHDMCTCMHSRMRKTHAPPPGRPC
eukprot:350494-Chlamydomonas_euryale.AAC.20